ncbi:Serine/threonine-protein kinase HipA [Andreprevotia sp. IGB-42]|uniref:type II toxin-antitoxin system HipA family toxin n=1 Tax=Andreprevotia sp. IGB-42 TaxID=2497473 RepID=UPI001358C637|nr:type II toxin-antitoxin system HipA family toxin [Andreprevotia sp. IGB-42]KAF0813466.1 Serine/threonine-protein kinase HipA [Andreprevotia sp. IGB-42]
MDSLNIWMNGLPVGVWTQRRDSARFAYFDEWVNDPQGRPLSLSLPFTPGNQPLQGDVVSNYFDNLLPDNEQIRRRLAQRHRTANQAPFALLAALGRDCVGAIQLLGQNETPTDIHTISGHVLDEAQIARLLRNSTSAEPLGRHPDGDGDLRLSIAGAQEKTALLYHDNQWLLPHGSTPTTHIFKLPIGLVGGMQADMRTSVENEWLCARIVAAYGLPIANCEIARFEDQKVLIVTRFDRRPAADGSWIMRLPQEDMCQATATPPHRKYQSDGGPGIAQIMDVLLGSDRAAADRHAFFKAQLVFWLLAATDGHAKNFSIAHHAGNRFTSTSLYDVLSAHPIIGPGANQLAQQKARLAMGVRSSTLHCEISRIQRRHWIAQAQRAGLATDEVEAMIAALISATARVIDQVSTMLPAGFPADLAEAVFAGLRQQSERLASMPNT